MNSFYVFGRMNRIETAAFGTTGQRMARLFVDTYCNDEPAGEFQIAFFNDDADLLAESFRKNAKVFVSGKMISEIKINGKAVRTNIGLVGKSLALLDDDSKAEAGWSDLILDK